MVQQAINAIGIWTKESQRLRRALRRAQGFALYFASCNVLAYRAALVEWLKRTVGRPCSEVHLHGDGDPYEAIARAAQEAPPEAVLFVYGLEQLLPSTRPSQAEAMLNRLNWQRAAYQRLERPFIYWVPEYVIPLLAQGAPDFFDWNSGLFVFPVPQPIHDRFLIERPDGMRYVDSLAAANKKEWLTLLQSLEEEYAGESPQERLARARVAYRAGSLHHSQGDYEAALEWYEKAVPIFEQLGDRAGLATSYNNIGEVHRARGDYGAALEWYEKSLALCEQLGDRAGLAATLHNMGYVALAQGDLATALARFTRSRDLYAAMGLEKDVAEEEEMIARVEELLQVEEGDVGQI